MPVQYEKEGDKHVNIRTKIQQIFKHLDRLEKKYLMSCLFWISKCQDKQKFIRSIIPEFLYKTELPYHWYFRVLIVDWDIHHGNGTQRQFYGDPR